MYIVAFCVFLIPTLLAIVAWTRRSNLQTDLLVPKWRLHCLTACLIIASLSIATGLGESLAWLHAGGDPHGMGTPTGAWVLLRKAFFSAALISVVLGLLAKGRGRFLGIAAALAALISNTMVVFLDMD